MPSLGVKKKLDNYAKQALIRKRIIVNARDKNQVIINQKRCINFCSSDYLGLATSDEIKQALIQGVQTYGFGSGASALISGYYQSHEELEQAFAEFLQRDRALFFNSGFLANLGVITTLAGRNSVVISDKLCHASLLDGIQLSKAKHYRYRHNDVAHLNDLINHRKDCLVITEGVFSMQGDITPIKQIVKTVQTNHSFLMLDDAHGIGVLGKKGGGVCDHFQLSQTEVPCLVTPLGKAFGGIGAIVAGKKDLMEAILQFSRSYIYTTALPPALASALLKTLELLKNETWRRERLHELIHFFIAAAKEKNLPLIADDPTPIKCFLIGDNVAIQKIQLQMLEQGFFISCIRPPTVPKGTARIRITLNCFHTHDEIEKLLNCLVTLHVKSK